MISQALKVGILLSGKRHYQIAQEAGLHPTTLSRLLNGIDKVKPNDERVLKVADIVGVAPEECFIA